MPDFKSLPSSGRFSAQGIADDAHHRHMSPNCKGMPVVLPVTDLDENTYQRILTDYSADVF